jgi:RHH-type transcriptional regulator, rel operon repressor / antitoxin RelB
MFREVAMRSTSISVKLPEPTKVRLDHLARATHRSRSALITTAVEEMLSVEEWQIKGIREALEEADSGNLIAHEEIKLEWETRLAGQVDK